MKLLVTLSVLLGLMSWAFAQDEPGKINWSETVPDHLRTRDNAGVVTPAILSGPLGVYVFNKGVLARFDAKTLQPRGVVELYGKMPALPVDNIDMDGTSQLVEELGQRLLPAGMAWHHGELLVLSGDEYFRVDPATLAIKLHTTLVASDQTRYLRVDDYLDAPAPRMICSGETLYRFHLALFEPQLTMTAIDIPTGKMLVEKHLPAALTTENWQYLKDGPRFNFPYTPAQAPVEITATPDAVYVLRYGGLAKLDPRTLAPKKVLALFGPVVNAADHSFISASLDHAQRMQPAVMCWWGKNLLIVSGDHFFCVDTDTMKISAQLRITRVSGDAAVQRLRELAADGPPCELMTKYGLLVTRGEEFLLVNPANGSANSLASLSNPTLLQVPSPGQSSDAGISAQYTRAALEGLPNHQNSSISLAAGESIFAIRHGVLVRVDAVSHQQTAWRDLLPLAPYVSNDAAATEASRKALATNRALRLATPVLIPLGHDLGVVAGNSYFLLDGATLKEKAHHSPGEAPLAPLSPFSNGTPNYLVDGNSLYVIYGNNLLRLDLATGNTANSVKLPEKLVHNIYPEK